MDLLQFFKHFLIKKLPLKRKVHSSFIDNIQLSDLAGMQLSKFHKDLYFYYMLLTFIANTHGLFL